MEIQAVRILWNHMKNLNYYICWVLRSPRIENDTKRVTSGPSGFMECYVYTSNSGNLLVLNINILTCLFFFFLFVNRFKKLVWINTELIAFELKEMF